MKNSIKDILVGVMVVVVVIVVVVIGGKIVMVGVMDKGSDK